MTLKKEYYKIFQSRAVFRTNVVNDEFSLGSGSMWENSISFATGANSERQQW